MSQPVTGEGLLIAYLNTVLPEGVSAYGDVPEQRPETFVTIERTGGKATHYSQQLLLAVGCWHISRAKAAALAEQVAQLLIHAPAHAPSLAATTVASIYNLPDPDSGQARYQLTATATIYNS